MSGIQAVFSINFFINIIFFIYIEFDGLIKDKPLDQQIFNIVLMNILFIPLSIFIYQKFFEEDENNEKNNKSENKKIITLAWKNF